MQFIITILFITWTVYSSIFTINALIKARKEKKENEKKDI